MDESADTRAPFCVSMACVMVVLIGFATAATYCEGWLELVRLGLVREVFFFGDGAPFLRLD